MTDKLEILKNTHKDIMDELKESKYWVLAFLVILPLVTYKEVDYTNVIPTLISLLFTLITLYLFIFIPLLLVNLLKANMYREFNKIKKSVDALYSKEFDSLDISEYKKFPKLKRYIRYYDAPDNMILYAWKYKIKSRKDTMTYLLPTYCLLLVASLKMLFQIIIIPFINLDSIMINNTLVEIIRYGAIIYIYLQKLAEMGQVTNRIDLIIETKNNVT